MIKIPQIDGTLESSPSSSSECSFDMEEVSQVFESFPCVNSEIVSILQLDGNLEKPSKDVFHGLAGVFF
jgi:hypothetical protein